MKEIDKFINGINLDKSVNKTDSKVCDFKKQLEKFKQKFLGRLEKEVPENGIFTNVSEQIKDNNLSCEYSKNQISNKKDLRVLKLYSQNSNSDKEKAHVLFEGTKKELLNFVKQTNFSDFINSTPSCEKDKSQIPFFNPSYTLISKNKQVSFGSNAEQNNSDRQNAIDFLKKKFQDVVNNPYCSEELKDEYNKRLSVLLIIEKSDLSYERIKEIYDLFLQSSCSADDALKIAALNDEQNEIFKLLPDVLGGVYLSYSDMADIALLDKEKYCKFIEIYNLKADESSYKGTLTQTDNSKAPIFSYYDYSKKYAESLIPVFQAEDKVYEQSLELIESGVEPVCLKNLTNIVLDDLQKDRLKILNKEKIVPSEELINIKYENIYDFAVNIFKNTDNADIDVSVLMAKGYALNYKTFDRFIETFKNAIVSNKFSIRTDEHYNGSISYECDMLNAVELISQYEDDDYKRANDLIKNGIPLKHIDDIINCNLKGYKLERAIDLLNQKLPNACLIASDDDLYKDYNEKSQTSDKYIASNETIKEYQQKLYQKLCDQGYNSINAISLSKLYGKELDRGLEIINRNPQITYLNDLLDNKSYKNAIYLLDKGYSNIALVNLSKLNDYDYDKAGVFVNNNINANIICDILEADDNIYNRALELKNRGVLNWFVFQQVSKYTPTQYKNYLYCLDKGINYHEALEYSKLEDKIFQRSINLLNKGLNLYEIHEIVNYDDTYFDRILHLLENGYNVSDSVNIAIFENKYIETCEKIESNSSEIKKLFSSEDYLSKIKKNSQGKYQSEIIDIMNPENLTFRAKDGLQNSGMSEQEFLSALQKFSKSTFKLAYDTPNQYLSDIDVKYTNKIDGKYPELPENVKRNQQNQIKQFFRRHLDKLLKTLNYLDTDTVNQMMDKRTEKFEQTLDDLNLLDNDNFKLLSDLIKCKSKETGKPLTASEKIQVSQICLIFQRSNLDFSRLYQMAQNGEVDLKQAKRIITEKILENAGFTETETEQLSQNDLKFNPEYIYTMLIGDDDLSASEIDIDTAVKFFRDVSQYEGMTRQNFIRIYCEGEAPEVREIYIDIYDHLNEYSDEQIKLAIKKALKVQKENSDLYVVVNHAVKGDFNEFISDKSNKYGMINANTQQIFENKGLNFDEWLKPSCDDVNFELSNKSLKIRMWDRNPNEDLFIGNKTTCCTAIGIGSNAAATPAYLLSQSFNVVELFDENGDAVGMSRIFMANVDGKPSVVMDNIELNQNFLKHLNDDDKKQLRNNFFKYMNNLAKKVTGDKDSQVYFSTSYLKVDASDLEDVEKNISFIGKVSQQNIYLNCFKGWHNPEDINEDTLLLYKVPKDV